MVPMVPMVPSLGKTSAGEEAQAINRKIRKTMPGRLLKQPCSQAMQLNYGSILGTSKV